MTKTLNEIITEIKDLPEVYTAKAWNDSRVYVNLIGFNKSFAGDRNLKIFWDVKTQEWTISGWKGTMSPKFHQSFYKFARVHCRDAVEKVSPGIL